MEPWRVGECGCRCGARGELVYAGDAAGMPYADIAQGVAGAVGARAANASEGTKDIAKRLSAHAGTSTPAPESACNARLHFAAAAVAVNRLGELSGITLAG